MQRQHLVPWLFLSLSFLMCGPSTGFAVVNTKPAPTKELPVAPPSAEAVAKLAQSSNAFGFDLYQRLRQKPGNLVISPASITTALTMAWIGAEEETAAQMRTVLHLEGTPDEVMTTSGQLSRSLQDPSRPIVFRIANQLFVEKTYKLVPDYLAKTRAAFGAPVELLDFKEAPERSRLHVNQWVEGKTEHRIKDLIPRDTDLSPARLLIVNAIYFLGDWAQPFKRDETRNLANFTGLANPSNPAERLVIARVFHKGFVRVDEKGTEAAAATALMGVEGGAAMGAGPRPVQVNRPFLFLIRDNASGLVLFLGRVTDPSRL